MSGVVSGERGGFITKRGRPRYAQLEGRHFVVGRGKAQECASIAEAYALRDALLKAEQSSYAAKRVAPQAPAAAPSWLAPGAAVRCDKGTGHVVEVNARSVLVAVGKDFYRRAAADLTPA